MELDEALHALIEEFHLEDYIYHVREEASGYGDGYEGNSWDHPKVRRFSDVVATITKEVRKV